MRCARDRGTVAPEAAALSAARHYTRRIAPLLGLVVAGLVVGVAVSEVGYRVARRWICVGHAPDPPFVRHPVYGWRHPPNVTRTLYGCAGLRFEWRVSSRMNAHGLRGRDHPYAKPAGTTRILLLGDSMTEALQVPVEQAFATLLEAELRDDGPVEVINGGVAGFGTDSALLFFREEGRRYDPDLVLLMLNPANDVLENSAALHRKLYALSAAALLPTPYFTLDASGELELDASGLRAPVDDARRGAWTVLEDNLYLLRLLRRIASGSTDPPSRLAALSLYLDVHASPVPEPWARSWRVTEAIIRRLAIDVGAGGARLLVAVLPTKWEAGADAGARLPRDQGSYWDLDRPTRTAVAMLARADIPHLALREPLRAHRVASGATGFYAVDPHLTADGHRVVADVLRPFLEAQLHAPR